MNNQMRSVYDCMKSLSQRAIKEISLELREVSISMSKLLGIDLERVIEVSFN